MTDRASPRILWVTEEAPDRELGGGNIRQAHLFEALAAVACVDLLVTQDVADSRTRAAASSVRRVSAPPPWRSSHPLVRRGHELSISISSPYPLALYPARRARRELAGAIAAAGEHDLVCVEHESLAPLVAAAHETPWLLTFHNLLSGMLEEELALAPGPRQRWFRARDLDKAVQLERAAVERFDHCIVCSEPDAARLAAVSGHPLGERVSVIPNGVDLDRYRSTPLPTQPTVLLPGTLSWPPNVDGAAWLCREVWPRVRAAIPAATLLVAGRSPAPEVLALRELPGVEVHPDVPSMQPYFVQARAVVVPLRVGTGTRLKALEAMAAARPLVGTSIGLDGLGVVSGTHALVADDPGGVADGLIAVLQSDEVATRLAAAGRDHVSGRFGWDQIGTRFVSTVERLVAQARASGRRPASNAE